MIVGKNVQLIDLYFDFGFGSNQEIEFIFEDRKTLKFNSILVVS